MPNKVDRFKSSDSNWIDTGWGSQEQLRVEVQSDQTVLIKTVTQNIFQKFINKLFSKELLVSTKNSKIVKDVQDLDVLKIYANKIAKAVQNNPLESFFDSRLKKMESFLLINEHKKMETVARRALPDQQYRRLSENLENFDKAFASLKTNRDPTEIAQLVREITAHADSVLEDLGKLSLNDPRRASFDAKMQHIFYNIIPKLSKSPFSKSRKLPHRIEEYLSPELAKARAQKLAGIGNPKELRHRVKVAKGALALKLGHGKLSNTGATGTLIIRDINGKPVGIHRVENRYVPKLTRLKNFFKTYFGGQLSYLSRGNMAQPKASKAASLVNEFMGLNLVPFAKEAELMQRHGVFEIFLKHEKNPNPISQVIQAEQALRQQASNPHPKYVLAKDHLDAFNKESFTPEELDLFQQFALFDYFIGNLDRHEENYMVIVDENNRLKHIKAIDNANAFPMEHPKQDSLGARNQYKWKKLGIAKQALTANSRELLAKLSDPAQVDEILDKIRREVPDFVTPQMAEKLEKRMAVLRSFASNDFATPSAIAQYSDDETMRALIGG